MKILESLVPDSSVVLQSHIVKYRTTFGELVVSQLVCRQFIHIMTGFITLVIAGCYSFYFSTEQSNFVTWSGRTLLSFSVFFDTRPSRTETE